MLKKINTRFLCQKTPYHAVTPYHLSGVICRLLTEESYIELFEEAPDIYRHWSCNMLLANVGFKYSLWHFKWVKKQSPAGAIQWTPTQKSVDNPRAAGESIDVRNMCPVGRDGQRSTRHSMPNTQEDRV